jgi:hypothetical protein
MRLVKESFPIDIDDRLRSLYDATGNKDKDIDESDLVIFRLMGASFEYSSVIFEETSPAFLLVESDVS